jgi:hypothetical protein
VDHISAAACQKVVRGQGSCSPSARC